MKETMLTNILEEENNGRSDNGTAPSHRHILLQMVKRIG